MEKFNKVDTIGQSYRQITILFYTPYVHCMGIIHAATKAAVSIVEGEELGSLVHHGTG